MTLIMECSKDVQDLLFWTCYKFHCLLTRTFDIGCNSSHILIPTVYLMTCVAQHIHCIGTMLLTDKYAGRIVYLVCVAKQFYSS